MKKIIGICMAMLLTVMFFACADANMRDGDKLSIVTTIFPEYDWVREILGDNAGNADVTMLLDNGVDLHSYQPTADDIIRISTCDMFIYVGGESDAWVEATLKEAVNPDMVVINLLDLLGGAVKNEKLVEGMEHEHEHDEAEDTDESDEHVWLSLKHAKTVCAYIAEQLAEIDAENADVYRVNVKAYTARLDILDTAYQSAVDASDKKTLLFGDRFPFRYLADDYGLRYYAAFSGCSAETEASFETVAFLANKIDELGLSCVLTIEGTNHRIAETILQSTQNKNQKILALDSMQSITSADVSKGISYLSIMEKNLEVLKEALR